ncbi:MAG: hypothetical protein EAZ44_06215 [Cytophagia bacterium]|nr:MAG: hypothetical protein EAZ44_06215 [Cytophagia bacterium]
MFQKIIEQKKTEWLNSNQNTIQEVINYIKQKNKLRLPQVEAIQTYLFLKIAGQNKPLWKLISEGFFATNINLNNEPLTEKQRNLLQNNTAALSLYELKTMFPILKNVVLESDENVDFEAIIKKFFYDINYTDYLFSLPMGAGKTFLMACFIYIDLYFALNEPENKIFAHNFIILVPSGLKSSIVPSLKSIESFDVSWVLPEPSASQIKRILKFEVLDQNKTTKKSNKTKNPNAQKIANLQPFEDLMGLVLVVNAEKVILDKVELNKNPLLIQKTSDEKAQYANELRYLIGKIPNLSILIDEVHHAATDDVKLRQVVNHWHNQKTINSVLGFSGTPYSTEKINIDNKNVLKITQITNVVYYYPLLEAVKTFLKKPLIQVEKGTQIQSLQIIKKGVETFYQYFGNTIYADNTIAKVAIYCSNIEKLEEEIYPFLVSELKINPNEILKYHQGNTKHKIAKENQIEFLNLDTPFSQKKIILLVQIGKEGWDCKSLTGVILSQKGDCPTNMVLQTACRCLRQIQYQTHTNTPEKNALICLNEDNEKSLDKQLKEEQDISLQELANVKNEKQEIPMRERIDRTPFLNVPKIDFYQLKVHFEYLKAETEPQTNSKITNLLQNNIKLDASYTEERELDTNIKIQKRTFNDTERGNEISFHYWLLQIVKDSFGGISFDDLETYEKMLQQIFDKITIQTSLPALSPIGEREIRYFNERFNIYEINAMIRKAFYCKNEIKTTEEILQKNIDILLIKNLKPIPESDKLMPSKAETDNIIAADKQNKDVNEIFEVLNETIKQKNKEIAEIFKQQGMENMTPNIPKKTATFLENHKNKTFHYLPYKTDSNFEKNTLHDILQDKDFQNRHLEVLFNGEDNLTNFKIECYHKKEKYWQKLGGYYPDFLIIQRNEQKQIHKLLILETKGEGFSLAFKDKKEFMEKYFIPQNNENFGYQKFDFLYLQDDQKNNLQTLNQKIKTFFDK